MEPNLQTQLTKAKDETLAAIDQMADEIRLKVHLGGMDVKSEWQRLEPRLLEAREHGKHATQEARDALNDIRRALEALAARL
jgi:hypothetical protein